ncbi:MAG: hypothetical protein J0M02_15555 [Planctomycetes bacterium]|nr:hypothetical protein [Planctomycetota bacterium]
MLTDILILVGFVAVWLLLAPCSPISLWKRGSCGWKPRPPADDPPTKP